MIVAKADVALSDSRRARRYDHGRFKRNPIPRSTDGCQEELPSIGTDRVRQGRDHDGERQQQSVGPAHFSPHGRGIGLAKEVRKKSDREERDDDGADSWAHANQSAAGESRPAVTPAHTYRPRERRHE